MKAKAKQQLRDLPRNRHKSLHSCLHLLLVRVEIGFLSSDRDLDSAESFSISTL